MLSLVIPAYNEGKRLPPTLRRVRDYLDEQGEEYEVIVVDDGSADDTVVHVEEAAAGWPQLRLIKLQPNQGKGAAVRAGMLAARGEHRAFSDADLSTPIEELTNLREYLVGPVEVAIASRALPDTKIEISQPRRRVLMGKVYNLLLRVFALRGIHDSQCGFKVFTAEAAEACFEPLQTMRFGFDAEVLVRARKRGYKIVEVPVRWSHMEDSRVSALGDSVETLVELLRLRWRMRRL
jgi:dolichyl-phosphate beta-glucosyltransferase